jgi:hypothetical protein
MNRYSPQNFQPSKERIYELIRRPIITEKATLVV